MSPSQFHFNGDGAQNADNNIDVSGLYALPLGVNKVSHCIKKSSPSSSSSSTSSLTSVGRNGGDRGRGNGNSNNGKAQHRHPVIIYTHSPKIIQTHPRDFMALVQKLTGLSQSEEDDAEALARKPKVEDHDPDVKENVIGTNGGGSEDADASSVVTEEHGISGRGDHGQVNSYFIPSVFDRPGNHPNLTGVNTSIPFFMPNNSDFLCSDNNPGYYSFGDPGLFNFAPNNNTRNPLSFFEFRS